MFEWLSALMGGGAAGVTAGGQGGFAGLGMGNPGSYGGDFATNAAVPASAQVPAASGGGITGLLADPNFQSFLAGAGASLDPDGVGGAIGKATQGMIQNKQMGKAMEKQDARWQALIQAMSDGKVTKATLKEDGKGGSTITLGAPETATAPQVGGTTPAPQVPESPFQQYMTNMQNWFNKYMIGGQ